MSNESPSKLNSYEIHYTHEIIQDVIPSISYDTAPSYLTDEEIRRLQTKRWQKENPESLRNAQRKYRNKHKEALNAKARANYAENKERIRAYQRERIQKNEECAAAKKQSNKKSYEKRKQQRMAQDPDFKKKTMLRDLRSKLKALHARNRVLNDEINENKSKIMGLKVQIANLKKDNDHLDALTPA